jgi:putative ABC transport system permease protein
MPPTPHDDELEKEIAAHLDLETAAFRDTGLSEDDARQAAHRLFGNTALAKEDTRAVWNRVWLERIHDDIFFAARLLRRYPAFSAAILIVLALGIGLTTTMFSVVNNVLIRPLPFHAPSGLVMLEEKWLPRFPRFEASPLDYLSWKDECRSYSDIAAFRPLFFNLTEGDLPERVAGVRVTANLPGLLGVSPVLGRVFREDEDAPGRNQVALLGHGLWQRRFGSDPAVVGRVVRMNGLPFTVIGVMPPAFRFPNEAEIWMPMGFTAEDLQSRGNHVVWGVGRLKPGVTIQQAQAEMDILMPRLHKDTWRGRVVSFEEHYVGDVRLALSVLLAAAGCLLLIACVNVANLFLARGAHRAREMSLRTSLGATRGRIVQQLLTESMFLAVLGGVLGLAIAYGALAVVRLWPWPGIYRLEETTLEPLAVVFAFGMSIATSIFFGVVPSLRLSRQNLQHELKGSGRTAGSAAATHARNALVIAEVALAVVLLVAAGLFVRNLSRLIDVPLGFNPNHVLAVTITLPRAAYPEPVQQIRFAEDLVARLRNVPDIQAVGLSSAIPFAGAEDVGIRFDGRTGDLAGTTANYFRVTPDLMRVMEIPLVRGRLITDQDTATNPPVVLINETMARRFFPDEDPIGKRLDISGPTYMRRIVGVVGDIKNENLRMATPPQVYEPFAQKPGTTIRVMLRTQSNPPGIVDTVRQMVRSIDSAQPISDARELTDIVARSLTRDRFSVVVLATFACLAMVVATVGLYGLIAYTVKQRTSEIGVRLALGAEPSGIERLVVKQCMQLVLVGLGLGMVGAILVTGSLSTLLYDVQPRDPMTFAVVALGQLLVGFFAGLLPARRAARVNPALVLRSD